MAAISTPPLRRWAGISSEGWPIILILLALVVLLWRIWGAAVAAPALVLAALVAWFFRDPQRTPPPDEKAIVSPADGRVVGLQQVNMPTGGGEPATRISIFLSIFNVHINRAPYQGQVREVRYNRGKFMAAFVEKASLENEQTAVILDTPLGTPLVFVQIAGWIARRIVCRLQPGDGVIRGQRFGLIRFGSRLDVYLPQGTEVRVAVGQRVRGGETVIGVFS